MYVTVLKMFVEFVGISNGFKSLGRFGCAMKGFSIFLFYFMVVVGLFAACVCVCLCVCELVCVPVCVFFCVVVVFFWCVAGGLVVGC